MPIPAFQAQTPSVRRVTDWRTEVIRADPEWVRDSNEVEEFKFSNGRIFMCHYKSRHPYNFTGLLDPVGNPRSGLILEGTDPLAFLLAEDNHYLTQEH